MILVEDLNGDGKTDGLFFNEKEFVTIELASGKELLRKSLAWADRIKDIKNDTDSGFLRVETGDGPSRRLKLIDPATLEVQWDIAFPQDTDFAGLLCGENSRKLSGEALAAGSSPDKPATDSLALTPRVLFTERYNGTSAVVTTTTAAQFKGEARSFASGPRLPRNLTAASFVEVGQDPRLIEPLPWNYYGNAMGIFEFDIDHSPVVLITQLFPIVLGGLVFPVVFVYTMVRRRRWNLQWFLLLPLVFVLPYILFQLPSALGAEYKNTAMPVWLGKLCSAILLLPFLVFIAVFANYVLQGKWKRLFWLTVLALTIPILMAVSEVISTPLLEGGRFDWSDPRSLWLLWASVWAGGVGIMIWWPLAFVGKAIFRLFRRRRVSENQLEPAV